MLVYHELNAGNFLRLVKRAIISRRGHFEEWNTEQKRIGLSNRVIELTEGGIKAHMSRQSRSIREMFGHQRITRHWWKYTGLMFSWQ